MLRLEVYTAREMRDFVFFFYQQRIHSPEEFSSFLEAILTTCYQIDPGNDEISVFFAPDSAPYPSTFDGLRGISGLGVEGVAGSVSRILR